MSNKAKYMQNRRLQRRQECIKILGGKCVECSTEENLQFDHIKAETKSFTISGWMLDRPWVIILEELDKCQLLCHSCHRKKTIANKETGGGHNKNHDPHLHGSPRTYEELKCRCNLCKKAKSLYRKKELTYSGLAL
jgi:hypothetical protein